jgi:hypothetical protein
VATLWRPPDPDHIKKDKEEMKYGHTCEKYEEEGAVREQQRTDTVNAAEIDPTEELQHDFEVVEGDVRNAEKPPVIAIGPSTVTRAGTTKCDDSAGIRQQLRAGPEAPEPDGGAENHEAHRSARHACQPACETAHGGRSACDTATLRDHVAQGAGWPAHRISAAMQKTRAGSASTAQEDWDEVQQCDLEASVNNKGGTMSHQVDAATVCKAEHIKTKKRPADEMEQDECDDRQKGQKRRERDKVERQSNAEQEDRETGKQCDYKKKYCDKLIVAAFTQEMLPAARCAAWKDKAVHYERRAARYHRRAAVNRLLAEAWEGHDESPASPAGIAIECNQD